MSRKAMKEEAGNGYTVWRLTPNPAFSNPRCDVSVQAVVHNIMRVYISVATTLSLTKLKSGIPVVHHVVILKALLFKYQ